MSKWKLALSFVFWLVACVPCALVATFALAPLWAKIEKSTGIESIGHSGPATWCYMAMYATLLAIALASVHRAHHKALRDRRKAIDRSVPQ